MNPTTLLPSRLSLPRDQTATLHVGDGFVLNTNKQEKRAYRIERADTKGETEQKRDGTGTTKTTADDIIVPSSPPQPIDTSKPAASIPVPDSNVNPTAATNFVSATDGTVSNTTANSSTSTTTPSHSTKRGSMDVDFHKDVEWNLDQYPASKRRRTMIQVGKSTGGHEDEQEMKDVTTSTTIQPTIPSPQPIATPSELPSTNLPPSTPAPDPSPLPPSSSSSFPSISPVGDSLTNIRSPELAFGPGQFRLAFPSSK